MLQSADSDYHIGPFENLHQLVENAPLVGVRAGLKVFFQYTLRCDLLRFADCPNSQLLISHCFTPVKNAGR